MTRLEKAAQDIVVWLDEMEYRKSCPSAEELSDLYDRIGAIGRALECDEGRGYEEEEQ